MYTYYTYIHIMYVYMYTCMWLYSTVSLTTPMLLSTFCCQCIADNANVAELGLSPFNQQRWQCLLAGCHPPPIHLLVRQTPGETKMGAS